MKAVSAMPSKVRSLASSSKRRVYSNAAAYVELTRVHLRLVGSNIAYQRRACGLLMASRSTDTASAHGVKTLKACIFNDICGMRFDGKVVSETVSFGGAWTLLIVLLSMGLGIPAYISYKAYASLALLHGTFIQYIPIGSHGRHTGIITKCRVTRNEEMYVMALIILRIYHQPPAESRGADTRPLYTMYASLICISAGRYITIPSAVVKRVDDVKAGVKSTALLFGSFLKLVLKAFAFAFVCWHYAAIRS
ncbi:hypothetical protein NM688_g40 [Phlebia brevispora]|uniref:Uncharacterized protein n=1 Tax=Phlebia brevispora TaxID=194682 RepID=A0ACC1TFN7_9APHY|nr:hypothetical protein NM688_g40 [Phlebia brevispora]